MIDYGYGCGYDDDEDNARYTRLSTVLSVI